MSMRVICCYAIGIGIFVLCAVFVCELDLGPKSKNDCQMVRSKRDPRLMAIEAFEMNAIL